MEQDSAYWEVHVQDEQHQQPSNEATTSSSSIIKCNAMFGVASKKDRQFYETLEASSQDGEGTQYL